MDVGMYANMAISIDLPLVVCMYGVIHADIRGPVAVDMDVGMANQVG